MHSDVKVAKALAKEYPRRSIQMELAEWIGPFLYAIATFFLLYRQNKIMEEQNRIMREQVGTVPAAALAIPRPSLVQHWPMLVMAVLTTATWLALGLFFYLRKPVTVEKQTKGQPRRSEEHTSELQSLAYLVCRLLLEK